MTTYNGFGASDPGLTFGSDSNDVSLATCFRSTAAGYSLTRIRIYCPVDSTGTLTGWTCALYASSGAGYATGSALTSGSFGTISRDAWNEVTLGAPYSLTQNVYYYATVWAPGSNYGYISGQFTSSAVTNGALELPQSVATYRNGIYEYSGSITPPGSDFGDTWYGVDVEISNSTSATPAPTTVTATGAVGSVSVSTSTGNIIATPATATATVTIPAVTISALSTPSRTSTGSWGSLIAALKPETQPPLSACPNDGEPLVTGPDGRPFCPYDGWRPA